MGGPQHHYILLGLKASIIMLIMAAGDSLYYLDPHFPHSAITNKHPTEFTEEVSERIIFSKIKGCSKLPL